MATKDKKETVKVAAVYSGFSAQSLALWGVDFVYEGDAKRGSYVAELDKDTANEMIAAGRVKAA